MLLITDEAAELVREIAAELGREPVLRVRVVAGGCSGLTWDFELGQAGERVGDLRRASGSVTVVVDPVSAQRLRGATVDVGVTEERGLRVSLAGSKRALGLVLRGVSGEHPCACGESFAP